MVEVPEANPIAGGIDDVVPSNGCGSGYLCAAEVRRTVLTMGTKAADCLDQVNGVPVCGAWSVEREYWVSVPAGYDSSKAYPLVIQAPGCGRSGRDVADPYGKREASMIRVGISPGPRSTGKDPTSLEDDCFDVHEGDDSIDWKFYERLYDKLNDEYCFDRRRLFVRGERGGGTLANELACKYAGDAVRPVRGVFTYDGDLPAEPQYTPTCSQAAVAGIWMQDGTDVANRSDQLDRTVSRAMKVAGCQAPDYEQAELQNFLIGAGQATDTCQRILGCDPVYPLVVCPIPMLSQTNNPQIQDPAFATFVQLFGPLP